MPTPNGRYLNMSGVSFTPDGVGGVAVPILGVTTWDFDERGKTISGSGDADIGPSSKHLTESDPQVTIEFEHLAAARALSPGTHGTLRGTQQDADNGEGTGAMEYVLSNCIIANRTIGQRHRQYGTSRLTVETSRPDGITHPLAITVAP